MPDPVPDRVSNPASIPLSNSGPDVVVVGSGPNGLSAAITLARAGRSVLVLEANDEIGGAARSITNGSGAVHDFGSAIHPLTVASPFMDTIDWSGHGLTWINPDAAVAHPLDDGDAAIVWRSLDRTAEGLGGDADQYRSLFARPTRRFDDLLALTTKPLPGLAAQGLRHPVLSARLLRPLVSPASLTARRFETERGRAVIAGHAAHSVAPLNRPFTSGFALLLGSSAHAVGWPFPAGGAGEITRVMAEVLTSLGGEIQTGRRVTSTADLPASRAVVFALSPRQISRIVGQRFSRSFRLRLSRFRYGPGVCKVDFDTTKPIPWANRDVAAAATVHVGGRFAEIAEAERAVARGRHPRRPFVLLAQHTLFDPSRAPDGRHTVWAYCHVPNGSTVDMSGAIEAQIERFAPGFRDTIVNRRVWLTADLEAEDANLVGGDVAGGSNVDHRSILRPWPTLNPYRTDVPAFFMGSASTPPGGGVHGLAGHQAALAVLDYLA